MNETFVKHEHIKAFAEKKVNLPPEKVTKYRKHIKNLRDGLEVYINDNPDYDLVKMFHSGSLAKGTALRVINDLDVAVYIKKSDSLAEGTKLLEWLKDRLHEVYPTLKDEQIKIPTDSHCVKIEFKTESIPDVDVVPVIYEGDKKDKGYLTTKTTGERVLTSIPLHLEFIRKRKDDNKEDYAQVVRLLKWWVKEIKQADDSFKFKSLMVEMLCAKFSDNSLDFSDYISALEKIFAYIVKSRLEERIFFTDYYTKEELPDNKEDKIEFFDPVNPENNIAKKYIEENKNNIINEAWKALDSIAEARFANTQARAVEKWQKIFGPTFNINL